MIAEDLEEFGFGKIKAEGFARDFEFVVVDVAISIKIEECKLARQRDHQSTFLGNRCLRVEWLTASRISSLCSSLRFASSSCARLSSSCLSFSRSKRACSRAC